MTTPIDNLIAAVTALGCETKWLTVHPNIDSLGRCHVSIQVTSLADLVAVSERLGLHAPVHEVGSKYEWQAAHRSFGSVTVAAYGPQRELERAA